MATIHNPSAFDLFCLPLRRTIEQGETVTVSAELARQVQPGVFRVEVGEVEHRPEKAVATRKTVTRGDSSVETTEAPTAEKR